jgi:hypothetical protein
MMQARLERATLGRMLVASAIVMCCGSIQAQSTNAPNATPSAFATGAPIEQKLIVEDQYYFTVKPFSPPVPVSLTTRERAVYDTPEQATMALISAMASQDFDWFRSVWDTAAIKVLEERDKKANHDASFWRQTWARVLANRRVELTTRIETGDYVLIAYRLVALDAAQPATDAMELTTPLKRENGRWFATQELAEDPVLAFWKTPSERPRRTMRGPRR